MLSMLMRISVPGHGPHNEPLIEPTYGGQIQGQAIPGVPREADVFVEYAEVPGRFPDGEPFSLRKPVYSFKNLGYGALATNLMSSPRVAPAMVGMGLLEIVPVETSQRFAAEQKSHGQGIEGRINSVWDKSAAKMVPGRYGWKAEQPSVLQQTAGAFAGDIGVTSSLFPEDDHTPAQKICETRPSGGQPEVSDKILTDVVLYACTLAVPGRRNWTNAEVLRGKALFAEAGCAVCHVPKMETGESATLPELSHQVIRPYTDLLLHDMGEELSDHRPVFDASGRDWRTPPLWGTGLVSKVNGHTTLLHDGRARDFSEAILWHGGEAAKSREKFRTLSKANRDALVAFLRSL
jgi:CxxC motif-containing protein (DUF1111 family)